MCLYNSPACTYPFWQLKMFDRGAQVKSRETLYDIAATGKEKDLLFYALIHKF